MVSKKTEQGDGGGRKNQMNQSIVKRTGSDATCESRKHVRFKVIDGAYMALNNGQIVVGRIKDVSMGGLAFEYLKDAYTALSAVGHIDLFMSEKNFYLTGLPSRVVYELAVPKDPTFETFSTVDMYKCGIRFGGLEEGQIAKLVEFIRIHDPEREEQVTGKKVPKVP